MMEDVRIVLLETRDDLLVKGDNIVISDKYIVAVEQESLFQFDEAGRFIRILAKKGNGPGEFNYCIEPVIDEQNNIFLYKDFKDMTMIYRIDLVTGESLEPLMPESKTSSTKILDDRGNIFGSPAGSTYSFGIGIEEESVQDSTVLSRYNLHTKEAFDFKGHHTIKNNSNQNMVFEVIRYKDDVMVLNLQYSDTIFVAKEDKLIPKYVASVENPLVDMMQGGNFLSFDYQYNAGLVMGLRTIEIRPEGGALVVYRPTKRYLFIDKNGIESNIETVTISPLGLNMEMSAFTKDQSEREAGLIYPIPRISGNWAFIRILAEDLNAIVDQYLESNNLNTKQKETIRNLQAQVGEDGNPVLFIGRIK